MKWYLVKWYVLVSNVRSLCEREINFGKLLKILITPRTPRTSAKWFKNCLMRRTWGHEETKTLKISVSLFQTYQYPLPSSKNSFPHKTISEFDMLNKNWKRTVICGKGEHLLQNSWYFLTVHLQTVWLLYWCTLVLIISR